MVKKLLGYVLALVGLAAMIIVAAVMARLILA